MRGTHRLVDDAEQIGRESLEVDLVAEPRREVLQRLRGVELRPIETAVDEALDTPSGRSEQSRHGQRRARHCELRLSRERTRDHLKRCDCYDVSKCERDGQRTVDECPVDDDVDVVQTVPEDRYADRHGDEEEGQDTYSV